MIDLRSDTVTLPSPGMRAAMAAAELGDDGYGEDPSVNRLEEVSADRFGTEAALFVSSGTMGNLIGLLVNARSGDEVIADRQSHVLVSEAAGGAMVGGIQLMPLPSVNGVFSVAELRDVTRPPGPNYPRSAAVVIETTHNRHGGVAWPLDELREVSTAAHASGMRVHIDGARVFNAALATGATVREITANADTITFCLSKGLGCPVGSVFCGTRDVVDRARHWRKMLGGSMRQAGVLAAAGVYALDNMVVRLAEDHVNARTLAEGLAELPGVMIDLERVQSNVVAFDVDSVPVPAFLEACAKGGVKGGSPSRSRVRFVTHYGINATDVQSALRIVEGVLSS
ncbi:MAG: threonine aldolase family protein [Candidatus Dormibacteria bacterium]